MIELIKTSEIEYEYINNKKILICSYQYLNLDKRVSESQKKVFDKFNIKLNQFQGDDRHSYFMNHIIDNYDCDFYIYFDIDCIPLKKGIIEHIIKLIGEETMIGIEQQCNSNMSINHIYAGPACFGISKKFYNDLNRPLFTENSRSDVGEELTHICEEMGKEFLVFKKTSSENSLWKLGKDRYFGHGTVYENDLLYHQFEIFKNQEKFIKKCESILNTK